MLSLSPHDCTLALIVQAMATAHAAAGRPILVGLSGSQGSGKTTLTGQLVGAVEAKGLRIAILSLDDFYLSRAERQELAERVHPLLTTRGVPGTHDIGLLDGVIDLILAGDAPVATPSFDKTMDDRRPRDAWPEHRGGADIVLLEGWCMMARPESKARLAEPINDLERQSDSEGRWRRHVNERLATGYAALFARLDLRIMLRAPGFEVVHGWRAEQERGLDRTASSRPPMSDADILRFISHYERLTRWLMEDEPADIIVDLAVDRRPVAFRFASAGAFAR